MIGRARPRRLIGALAFALLAFAPLAQAQKAPDPEVARLADALSALDQDPALADKAGIERFRAREALTRLREARKRERDHARAVADAWVRTAQEAAQAELLIQQGAQLDRDRDQIMLEASRREADAAWREADRMRLQNLMREEEAQRARQAQEEALAAEQLAAVEELDDAKSSQSKRLAAARAEEQALARREAELAAALGEGSTDAPSAAATAAVPPSRKLGNLTIYTLDGSGFASGSATLSASAQASLVKLAAQLGAGKRVRVLAHTDSQGADAANLALSQRRADAVRTVLAGAGVPASRITATGRGETDPITDNGTPAGRARNRRVEIQVR